MSPFLSNQIDNKSYNFVVLEDTTVTKSNTTYYFDNLNIYEGQLITYNFGYNATSNPKQVFTLPDSDVDASTLYVTVQPSATNTDIAVYTLATDASNTSTQSQVFYLQEDKSQKYQIYFGDDTIGKKLPDGSIVNVTYLITNGDASNKANNFVATDTLTDSLNNNITDFDITPVSEAAGGVVGVARDAAAAGHRAALRHAGVIRDAGNRDRDVQAGAGRHGRPDRRGVRAAPARSPCPRRRSRPRPPPCRRP